MNRSAEETLWLTVPEVAKSLRISETLVRQLLTRGEIPYRRLGRIIRIPSSALGLWTIEQTLGQAERK